MVFWYVVMRWICNVYILSDIYKDKICIYIYIFYIYMYIYISIFVSICFSTRKVIYRDVISPLLDVLKAIGFPEFFQIKRRFVTRMVLQDG